MIGNSCSFMEIDNRFLRSGFYDPDLRVFSCNFFDQSFRNLITDFVFIGVATSRTIIAAITSDAMTSINYNGFNGFLLFFECK
jgi:hypothetical protein